MPRTLAFGSVGNDVTQLQQQLNTLPSKQTTLATDGQFGGKTRSRVVEFQSGTGLTADGVVGPITWDKLLALLAQVAQGGVPIVPGLPGAAYAPLRPLVMTIAQQCMGKVDFSITRAGKPMGLDFLIEMFRFAANVQLTEANFRKDGNGAWTWIPWIGLKTQQKSWCGVFAVSAIARPACRSAGTWVAAGLSGRSSWRNGAPTSPAASSKPTSAA